LEKRAQENAYQVDLFLKAHPEYIPTEKNSELIQKYLLKHELGVTKKNLEAAFEELKADGLLTLRVPEPAKEETPQVSSASDSTEEKKEKAAEAGAEAAPVEPVVENTPAPPVPVYVPGALLPKDIFAMTASEYETWFRSGGKVLPASLEETIKSRPVDPNLRYLTAEEIGKISQDEYDVWYRSNGKVAPASLATIPAETTVAAPISEQPSEVRTSKLSSSGLSAEHSSVKNRAPSAPKTKGITIQEINAMDSREYERRLADPEFRAAVEELFKK
jgi:hypothetical protein